MSWLCYDDVVTFEILSCPQPPPWRMKARGYTVTLYLLFKILVGPNLITKSKYHKQRYKKKNYHCSGVYNVNTYSPKSNLHMHIQKLYIYIYIIRARNLLWCTPTSLLAQQYAEDCERPPLYLHGLKPVLSLTLSGKHMTYMYIHALILIYSKHITVTDIQ